MKIFYLLMLGALCSLPLKANSPEFADRHPMALKGETAETVPTKEANYKKVIEEARSIVMNSPAASTTVETTGLSLEGEWNFKMRGMIWNDLDDSSWFGMLVGRQLLLEPSVSSGYPIIGDFDAETNILTISKHYVARDWRGRYIFIRPYKTDERGIAVPSDITAEYNPETGELKFNPRDYLAWLDYKDPEGTEDQYDEGTWYHVLSANRSGDMDKEKPENWEYLGEATLIDGWVTPRFFRDQNLEENWLKVGLYRYTKNTNLYRLKNPFADIEVEGYEMGLTTGYIEFDVHDPDHVLFNRIDSGWTCPRAGITKFYCYNVLGYFMEDFKQMGQDQDVDIFVQFTDPYIPYTTFKDGIVDLSGILYNGEITYDANYGDATYTSGGNMWINFNMRSRIYFPGVEVTEPQIFLIGEPEVVYDSKNKSAAIDLDFIYENLPDNGTIFVVVYEKASGLQVARKYVNLSRFDNNHYSFVLDGVDASKDKYAMRIQMEGGLSEVIAKAQPIDLILAADSRDLIAAGVEGIGGDTDAPAYYNLQGVRIDSPEKGGIYIKVTGDKAVKVIF